MENIDILIDLALAMGAALVGGFLAHRLGQPAILGYLVAGMVIGPYTPGPVTDIERVQTLANFGVALLMFALGTEFSLSSLQRVRNVAVQGGIIQILLTIAIGMLLGLALGFPFTDSIFLGGIIAISSSILILKLLMARDELEAIHGRIALALGIVQDISMVPLIIILPSLAIGLGPELVGEAGFAVLRGALFLVVAYVLGTRLVPPLLAWVARAGSRELFLLTVVATAAGTAVLGQFVGISFALGAFVGGLIVSESEFSGHVLDEIIPIRDVFSTLFFVSIGMLMNPMFLLSHPFEIVLMVVVIMVGKLVVTAGVVRLFGYTSEVALRTGLLMAQIGEFSFVLASVGLAREAISDELYNLVLASALVSLFLNPILVNSSDRLLRFWARIVRPIARPLLRGSGVAPPAADSAEARLAALTRHVVICGYGRVGQEVSRALSKRNFPFVVIDYSPGRVEQCRREGNLCLQGDATNPAVLERGRLRSARMLIITLPDLPSAEQVVRLARQVGGRVRILARTHDARTIPHLKGAGAHEIVQPEFEAGLEMVRQALRSFGVSSLETQSIVGGRRQEHYEGAIPRTEHSASEDTPWV
jgi:monovalent cation:H+ antiporter-2, CPA2 family